MEICIELNSKIPIDFKRDKILLLVIAQITLCFTFRTATFHRAQMRKHYQYNHNSCQRKKKKMYLSIFLNEIRIWTIWLVQFISPNLHRVRGHKFVLENTIYNEEIPTSISVYRSRSNNNEEVSCPTYTSMGQYLLDNNVISLLCFILV